MVTGDDREVITREAERIARMFWEAREDFVFVAETGSLEEALAKALAPDAARPYLISDSGDNPTAGGAGDVTWTLAHLLDRREFTDGSHTALVASVFDADAVAQAVAAGAGATVSLSAGARVDDGPHGPVEITGTVFSITEGDPDAGTQVVIAVGGLHAIITERRKPFHHLADFRMLGLEPTTADMVVVLSLIHI